MFFFLVMWWVSRLVIHTGLPVGGGGVGAALVAGEVDERELAVHAVHAGGAHHYLEHGVRPRRVRVRRRLPHTDKHYKTSVTTAADAAPTALCKYLNNGRAS